MKKVKRMIYGIARNSLKNRITNNLGTVVETEDQIICYVKKNKIPKKNSFTWDIPCFGISKEHMDLLKKYNLNKKIIYVFSDITFDKNRINIFGYDNCEVILKNCDFKWGLFIHVNGNCVIDNCNITAFDSLSIGADDLTIKNIDLSDEVYGCYGFRILFGASKKMNLVNCNFGNNKKRVHVDLMSNEEINIDNSSIYGDDIKIQSDEISINDSKIDSSKKVVVESKKNNPVDIASPIVIYNGVEITNRNKQINIDNNSLTTYFKRLELIETLKKIRNNCEEINERKLTIYKDKLNSNSISKVLKKTI